MAVLSDYVEIDGLLLPATRDRQGKVLSLSIATFDEQTYMVRPGQAAKAMIGLVGKEVRVRGRLHFGKSRETGVITVQGFEKLPDSEPNFWTGK